MFVMLGHCCPCNTYSQAWLSPSSQWVQLPVAARYSSGSRSPSPADWNW